MILCNMLLDELPTTTPNGYKIETNFRNVIKFELLMQDRGLTIEEKLLYHYSLFYNKIENIEKQIEDMIWFYQCGKNNKKTSQQNKRKEDIQIYSYEFDDTYIYSAFLQQYNIDLINTKYMHWWKFKSLFESLNKDTRIVEIMGYRGVKLNDFKDDKAMYKFYKKMKKIYALPDMRTEEEKEADFAEQLW